eukprot:gene9603-7517_t
MLGAHLPRAQAGPRILHRHKAPCSAARGRVHKSEAVHQRPQRHKRVQQADSQVGVFARSNDEARPPGPKPYQAGTAW